MPWGKREGKVRPKQEQKGPKRVINWEQIDSMLIAGYNGVQCAASIGVCSETLYERCEKEKGVLFSVYSQSKRAHGNGLLHAAQFQKAIKDKNPTMLIWLGKQRLDQKETLNDTPNVNGDALSILHDKIIAENTIQELKDRLAKYESTSI